MLLAPWRLASRLLGLLASAAVAYLLVSFGQVWAAAHVDQTDPAQALVVLGAAQYDGVPSPDLAARLSHAMQLWQDRVAPVIVVAGGKEPGDSYTEAAAGADWLSRHGVPESAIVRVVQGRDTWQSLVATAAVLRQRGERRVVLVSDPFHDERIRLMSASLGLDPTVSPTRTSPLHGAVLVPYYAKESVEVAVGRVIGFRRLSEMTRAVASLRSAAGG